MTLGILPPPNPGGGGSTSPLTTKGDIWVYDSADVRLPVGTDGQVLTADSTQTKGMKWAALTSAGITPLTTKGDLWTFSTVDARLAVGANGTFLTADSTQATGIKWTSLTASMVSPLTTKGDLWVYSTVNTRLAIGTDGYVLVADSASAAGMKWAVNSASAPVTTKGDIFCYSTANDRLPVGSDGKVLTADSAQSTGLAWSAANAVGGMVRIAQVVTTSSATTVSFTSIPGTYSGLLLQFTAADPDTTTGAATTRFICVTFNSDTTSGNYLQRQSVTGTGTTAAAATGAFVASKGIQMSPMPNRKNNANAFSSGTVMFPAYANTTFHKAWQTTYWMTLDSGPTTNTGVYSGGWKSTSAITRIDLATDGTQFLDGSIFTLYGLA